MHEVYPFYIYRAGRDNTKCFFFSLFNRCQQSLHPQFKLFHCLQLLLVMSSVDQTSLQIQTKE